MLLLLCNGGYVYLVSTTMKTKLPLLLLFTVVLVISACRKNNSGSVDHNSLIGEWQWVMQTDANAIFGQPYDTLTPASIGILSRKMTLSQDSTYVVITLRSGQQQLETG